MRIVLFHNWSSLGYAVAQALIEQGDDELVLIGPATEHPDMELVEDAARRGIPCEVVDAVDNESFARDIVALAADLAIVATFPMRLPAGVLGRLPLGAFNVHPSLLPAYRGPSPAFWALRNGDAETGVTIHELEERFDAGAIVAQSRLAIEEGETARTLDDKMCGAAPVLVLDFVARLRAGESVPRVTQDESRVTRARTPRPEDLTVRWQDSARSIERLVCASGPGQMAMATLGGEPVGLFDVQLAPDDEGAPLGPGELRYDPDDRTLRCGTGVGALLLEEVDVAGVTLDAEDLAIHLGLCPARDAS